MASSQPISQERSDRDILHDVEVKLRNEASLSAVDFLSIDVSVRNGVASLSGHVRFPAYREEVEALVRAVDGVVDVEDHLYADQDLEHEIIARLEHDERTQGQTVRVMAFLGKVVVQGRVISAEIRDAVRDIVSGVPGITAIHLELVIDPKAGAPKGKAKTHAA